MRSWQPDHFPESPRKASILRAIEQHDNGWVEIGDSYLRAAGPALDKLLHDYRFVRAGDLASLALCNNWLEVDGDGCGYAIRLEGASLLISPDPFGGRTIPIEIDAREIAHQSFGSAADARRALASAPVVTLGGLVGGFRTG